MWILKSLHFNPASNIKTISIFEVCVWNPSMWSMKTIQMKSIEWWCYAVCFSVSYKMNLGDWEKAEKHKTRNSCQQVAAKRINSLLILSLGCYQQRNPDAVVAMMEDHFDDLNLFS